MVAIHYGLIPAHVYSTRYNVFIFSISISSLTHSWTVEYSTVPYFSSCSCTPLLLYPSQYSSSISSSRSDEEMVEGKISKVAR